MLDELAKDPGVVWSVVALCGFEAIIEAELCVAGPFISIAELVLVILCVDGHAAAG